MTTAKRPSGGKGAGDVGTERQAAALADEPVAKSGKPKAAKAEKPAPKRAAKTAAAGKVAKPAYSAPALEKGLDVLELLASLSEGVTPSQIAQQLGRSLQEVYRVVVALERRGYIQRPPGEESLVLS
ncbi:MAG TPA: helix-turn-helix domain-containing protein, partial [Kaistia sp.]|nr:helix-turn-helix domain-containing protein [Kaistia sp.]